MTTQTLGQQIGVLVDNFSISQYKGGPSTQLKVTWDFSTATNADIKSWLCGSRRIAFQRPTRGLSMDEIKAISGSIIMATDAGCKVKSRTEKIAVYTSMGLPENMATIAVDDPTKFQAILDRANELDESNTVTTD